MDSIVAETTGLAAILEVGPGPGVLTQRLAASSAVTAIEIDPVSVSALSESAPSAKVIQGDALRLDWRALLSAMPIPRGIVSNMPYHITGPLLERLAGAADLIDRAILMMQKEVGAKIVAPPGDPEHGSLSAAMQLRFSVRRIAVVPKGAFLPPPKVDSIVLRFEPRNHELPDSTFSLIRSAFRMPRKTLANNLVAAGWNPERAIGALDRLGLARSVRPHQVPIDVWRELDESR
ncbi:MAG: Ribosomal RNA small subunit methyltransferase A [Fimbriimonadaceae bacterium]|nr:Ribosomal RNA small subunit methyltransferase A [Fimbriimonadaceae bacterium]